MTIPPEIIPDARKAALMELSINGGRTCPGSLEEAVFRFLADFVWRKWMSVLEDRSPSNRAEGAVAECIRRGVEKKDISYSRDIYELHLPNGRYYISRECNGYKAKPADQFRFTRDGIYGCDLPKGVFADFLFSFDASIPEIREAAGDTIRELRAIYLQQQKNHLIRTIQLRHLSALLEECTSPLGLKGDVRSAGIDGKRFTISVRNKEGLEWKTTGSFEKLCQLLEEGSFLERFTTNS